MTNQNLSSRAYRELIFWVGVVATVAYRIIIVLNDLPNRWWSDLAWYIGTLGFVWYFAHRYRVEKRRADAIKAAGLMAKLQSNRPFSQADKQVLHYTLSSLESSKASWNYIVIFLTSALALLWDLWQRLSLG